jgi:hypothetical protein
MHTRSSSSHGKTTHYDDGEKLLPSGSKSFSLVRSKWPMCPSSGCAVLGKRGITLDNTAN